MTKNMIESIAFAIIGLVLTVSSLTTKAGWEVTVLSVISLALACYCIYMELKSNKLCKCCCKDVAPVVEAEPEVHIVETKPVKKTTTKKATTKKATTKAAPKKTTKKK